MNKNYGDCSYCSSFQASAISCLAKEIISSQITESVVSINYKKGQDIFVEESPFKGVFCIQEGKVKKYKSNKEKSLTLGFAGNSDFLGYTGFFNKETYIYSARCLEDSQICFIQKNVFLNLVSSNNELLIELLKRSSNENYRMSNFIKDLKWGNMLSRVAGTLIEIAAKFGVNSDNYLNLILTRKEIAEISGTTTESVIRILNQLKKEGTIGIKKNQIKILDNYKLQKDQLSL